MKKIGDILGAFFDEKTLEKARGYGKLFSTTTWEDLTKKCGLPAAVSHSRIASLERKTLLIEADHSSWLQLLQTRQRELLDAVHALLPNEKIHGVAFKLGQPPMNDVQAE